MTHLDRLVAHIREKLGDLNVVHPDAVFQYASLPLCVIDAVFSIGVRYGSTKNVVKNWCDFSGWELERSSTTKEHTISEFLGILRPYENRWEEMATQIFRNHHRTSSTSGILKAEAAYQFAETVQRFGIENFTDKLRTSLRPDIRAAITPIRGQGSGLSFSYFLILAGNKNAVKPDRMVTRFVLEGTGLRRISTDACADLVREAAARLRDEFPNLTPSLLDHAIWEYQRQKEEVESTSCRNPMPRLQVSTTVMKSLG
jgi:hypothetical protein